MVQLESVINGTETTVDLPSDVTPSSIVDYMKQLGYDYDLDTNGWEHDFWFYFRKIGSPTYMYSGCWWDGSHSFSIDEDETDETDDYRLITIDVTGNDETYYDPMQDPKYLKMIDEKEETSRRVKELYDNIVINGDSE
jgi:hypothetical protein